MASRVSRLGTIWLLAVLLILYGPDVGHGFLRDDFRWIVSGHLAGASDLLRILGDNVGMYRPLVTLSFGLDRLAFGLHPLGYGLTNLALLLATAIVIIRLGRQLGLGPGFDVLAAAIWALNFHGIGGSVLWLSGRTALMLCLFGTLAVSAWVADRPWRATAALAAALLSKEEAVLAWLLCLVIGVAWPRRTRWRTPLALAVLVTLAYLVLRLASGAFWPSDAPAYYRYSLEPATIARNVLEYMDRTATLSTVVVLAALLWLRTRPDARALAGPAALAGAWVAVGFAPTLLIPARSSLYVLWPGIGLALLAATIVEAAWRARTEPRRIVAAALVLPLLAYPVYRARNAHLVALARLSQSGIEALAELDGQPSVVIADDRSSSTNLDNAWGTLLDDVRRLAAPRTTRLSLDPPPQGWHEPSHAPGPSIASLHVVGGRVTPLLDARRQ